MSDSTLKVSAAAISPVLCDPDANLSTMGRVIATLDDDTDLLVLPELFSTGFPPDAAALADAAQTDGGSVMSTVSQLARRHNIAIAGTFLARSGHRFYNRAFFVEPSGDEYFHDKHHLFSLGDESRLLTSGNSLPPLIRFRGWNISMIICYDLRFPVWCREAARGADLLLVPANWPDSRAYAWQHLLVARAIENQCCVVGANRSGSDDCGVYTDSTFILDAMGNSIAQRMARRAAPAPVYTATLSLDRVQEVRRRLPAGDSADRFSISLLED